MVTLKASSHQDYMMPDSLRRGDKVAIVSPATHIRAEYVQGACEFLQKRGFAAVVGKHCLGNKNDYSGTIDERFADLHEAFADPTVKAVLCARGGYGAVHFIDRFEESFLRDHAKWLVGFSDITALHAMMINAGVTSVHGPMAKYIWENPESNEHIDRLLGILQGNGDAVGGTCFESHELNMPGTAEGVLVGGNMAVFNGLNGSKYDFREVENPILFIEDVGEPVYKIERMLYNMRLNGFLSKISGLIVGQFTEYDTERYGETMEQMIHRLVGGLGVPVAFNAPFGHGVDNMPLIEGQRVVLSV